MARWISGVGDVKTLGQGELLVCFSGDFRGSSEVSTSEMSALATMLALWYSPGTFRLHQSQSWCLLCLLCAITLVIKEDRPSWD